MCNPLALSRRTLATRVFASVLLTGLAGCAPVEPGRTVVVMLDGGSWSSIDPLLEAGELPNLRKMIRGGLRAPLRADPPFSPPSWTSLATGLTPTNHGVTNFVKVRPRDVARGSYDLVPIRADDVIPPRFWNMLSSEGRTVSVQRWLFTWPTERILGAILSDHGGVARDFIREEPLEKILEDSFERRIHFTPDARITREKPPTPFSADTANPQYRRRDLQLDAECLDIDRAEQAFHHVLDTYPEIEIHTVSFFWGNQIQHEFNHYWKAPELYGARPQEVERYGSVVPDLYRLLDDFLGGLLEDPRIERVLVISDHGMDLIPMDLEISLGAYHLQIRWDQLLADLGYAKWIDDHESLGPDPLRSLARRVDYRRTESGIEFTLPGHVTPDAEATRDSLATRLASDLESLHFADDRTPLFSDVGPPETPWPDLVVGHYAKLHYGELPGLFTRKVVIRGNEIPAHRYLRLAARHVRSEHGYDLNPQVPLGRDGILVGYGDGIAAGVELAPGVAHNYDFTPTLLHLLGVAVAEDFDGRVLEEALVDLPPIIRIPSYARQLPPKEFPGEGQASSGDYDRATLERLRALGYVN